MAAYHSPGVTDAGTVENMPAASCSDWWVMLAPRFWGMAASAVVTVAEGWAANMNSREARTPSGRRDTRVSSSLILGRSEAGAMRRTVLRAGRRERVGVLGECQRKRIGMIVL